MLQKIQKYWRIFWKFRQIQLMSMLEYRKNFFFWSAISLMWTAFNYFSFSILVGVRGELAGWNATQIYLLLGVFQMIDAFFWSFLSRESTPTIIFFDFWLGQVLR
jgi:ABC-type uncharacterized transport system permease subunit